MHATVNFIETIKVRDVCFAVWIVRFQLTRDRAPGGGGDSHIKRTGGGCSSEILKRTPKRYQDTVLWAWRGYYAVISMSI